MWTTLTCRPLIAWPPPTKDHTIWGTRHSKEYCRLVTAHTSAPRKRYKDTIKKALKACSIVLKHRTATAEMPDALMALYHPPKNWIWNPFGIWNPPTRIQNPVREIWNLHHGIQNPILSWNTLYEANYTSTTPEQHPSNLALRSGRMEDLRRLPGPSLGEPGSVCACPDQNLRKTFWCVLISAAGAGKLLRGIPRKKEPLQSISK